MDSHSGIEVDMDRLAPDSVKRVLLTLSCRDTDQLPKVDNAGTVIERDGELLQVMHNGLLVEEGCYYGPWMTEIIKGLEGHHEPQEEIVFDAILRRLQETGDGRSPVLVEFGSFWAYYSMWFCAALPGARAVAMEPDPAYLAIGRRNAALNGLTDRIQFLHGAVGSNPGAPVEFVAESSGEPVEVRQFDLASLLLETREGTVDVAMIDIQGFETVLLERARDLLSSGSVRFAVVSTHHWSISGDHLTHQKAREILVDCGGHIVAEHSVGESFSGDGLIVVSFDARDADLTVAISRARPQDSVYGEPERELAAFAGIIADRDATVQHYQRHTEQLEAQAAAAQAELDRTVAHYQAHVDRIEAELAATRLESVAAHREPTVAKPTENQADARTRDDAADRSTISEQLASGRHFAAALQAELIAVQAKLDAVRAELDAVHASKVWRWSSGPRRVFSRLRR